MNFLHFMQQMSLGKWSVLRYCGSATAKQDVQPDEVKEFKMQQLTVLLSLDRRKHGLYFEQSHFHKLMFVTSYVSSFLLYSCFCSPTFMKTRTDGYSISLSRITCSDKGSEGCWVSGLLGYSWLSMMLHDLCCIYVSFWQKMPRVMLSHSAWFQFHVLDLFICSRHAILITPSLLL